MPTVCVNPLYQGADRADGGIRRVSDAMAKYLPQFGWNVTNNPDGSDVIANHGTLSTERPGVPMVACCHGLYWHDYEWPLWSEDANARVANVIIRSDACTVPSKWVAKSIQRGLLRQPNVIYHGVDIEEWRPPQDGPRPFVLWNKARKDAVSHPGDMQRLAGMLPNIPFISTIGDAAPNVEIMGVRPYDDMKEVVQHARIGLITTRETFGIGTIEMLAAGVPIVGWDYGGQSEIIRQGESGILVPHGDFGALAEAVQSVWNDHRRFSNEARQDAIERWQWPDRIKQYADLFTEVVRKRQWRTKRPKLSVVLTCYNLARYLSAALQSVAELGLRSWECIIVDDHSTDETEQISRQWEQRGNFHYYKTPQNLGLSGARNYGAQFATGEYLLFFDADDILDRGGIQELVDALDRDSGIHIAYGSLDIIEEDGGGRRRNGWPDGHFDWRAQIAHLNQLPSTSLMRRTVFESVGGYRTRDWRAEDASFWTRATSFGFRAARVTERPVLAYRVRGDSKSGQERNRFDDADGDWTAWFPFRLGASEPVQGERLYQSGKQPPHLQVPFGAQGTPPAPHLSWPVRHHANPLVSVIVPVGPGHEPFVVDALDSLVAQTFPDWEVVVVNDTGRKLLLAGHPFAQIVDTPQQGSGAGFARNLGVKSSIGRLLFFLDADDWLRPDALELMVTRYAQEGGYVYSDCAAIADDDLSRQYTQVAGMGWSNFSEEGLDGAIWKVSAFPYNRVEFMQRGYEPGFDGAHTVSILIAREDHEAVGGFDEKIPFWEDWEYMLRQAYIGVCGQHIPEPLLTYRLTTGRRRQAAKDVADQLRRILRERYARFVTEVDMGCGCGGGGSALQQQARATVTPLHEAASRARQHSPAPHVAGSDASPGFKEPLKVSLRYLGQKSAPVPFAGKATGTIYRAARDALNEVIYVDPADVDGLLLTKQFEVIEGEFSEVVPEVVRW